jgi:hypothetical protein
MVIHTPMAEQINRPTQYEAKDWGELNELLWSESWDRESGGIRPYVAFRGLPQDYREKDLQPGIQRIGDDAELSPSDLAWRERRLIETFLLYGQTHFNFRHETVWDALLLGQHYRLPTRLLDWTSSPFVALFFAIEDPEKDSLPGVVWCVDRLKTNRLLSEDLKSILGERRNLFSVEIMRRQFPDLQKFDAQSVSAPIWFEPPAIDQRIVAQFAFFSVLPGVSSSHLEWFRQNPQLYRRIVIPPSLKKEVRGRLQVLNITHRTLFPGLDGLARYLREYYRGPRKSLSDPPMEQIGTLTVANRP